jgi:hypothetical protein
LDFLSFPSRNARAGDFARRRAAPQLVAIRQRAREIATGGCGSRRLLPLQIPIPDE